MLRLPLSDPRLHTPSTVSSLFDSRYPPQHPDTTAWVALTSTHTVDNNAVRSVKSAEGATNTQETAKSATNTQETAKGATNTQETNLRFFVMAAAEWANVTDRFAIPLSNRTHAHDVFGPSIATALFGTVGVSELRMGRSL